MTATTTTRRPAKRAKAPARPAVEIDERTGTMSQETLLCRGKGHRWDIVHQTPARRVELAQRGQREFVFECDRCESRKTELYELPTYELVSKHTEYSEGYLVDKKYAGTGRIPRRESFKAFAEA